jgi:hypothetical protein
MSNIIHAEGGRNRWRAPKLCHLTQNAMPAIQIRTPNSLNQFGARQIGDDIKEIQLIEMDYFCQANPDYFSKAPKGRGWQRCESDTVP